MHAEGVVPAANVFQSCSDACLFGLGGLAFVTAWLWPDAVIFPTTLRWVGIALIGVALVLIAATMNTLRRARTSTNPIDAPSQLLVAGPFSWSRNPLYVAYVVALCGCALASGSWLALGCPLLGFVVINGLIIPI
nr:methyltransferase [uncultured Corynebacterium sp.]